MSQVFPRSANLIARATIFGALLILSGLLWLTGALARSPYTSQRDVVREQPIPFSHRTHVGGLGIDCRYCHTSVEESAFAGMPPTKTCMNCHAQIWAESPMLEPVRESFRTGRPIRWNRVHDLPGFAFFDHSIHVKRGVACATCHGDVDRMPLMTQTGSLFMEECLACHRSPERHLGLREEVFRTAPGERPAPLDPPPVRKASTDCSACHR